ncbi:MAG TPA: DUF6431 domain-containing protein [Streptosporangiaceae bacterium]|nr:DUF6431 domain-containing protein [Streptosporangiaceae bacterium]
MIEVFDTAAARIAVACRKLGCPGCGQPLRPWGHARERTVRDLDGTPVTVRPDRALCTGCDVTHVVLDAGLLPRRAYAVGLIGQALVAAALGSGHRRIARDLAVPAGTVRGWIRGARRSAAPLRITGIRAVVAYDQDALPAPGRSDELGCALEHLGAAAMVIGRRFGLQRTSVWARVNVLTRGRLLAMAPAG